MKAAAAALLAATLGTFPARGIAATAQPVNVDMQRVLDFAELEVSFDTLLAQYYRDPSHQRLLDGARVGVVAYLRERGVAAPDVPAPHATGVYAHDLHELDRLANGALNRYGGKGSAAHIDVHALIGHAIAGELAALNDPYTQYFSPSEYRAFTSFLGGHVEGGIGAVLHYKGGRVLVDRVFARSPALRAGLRPGDEVVAIDATPVAGLTADAVGDRMHGDVGTRVRLSIVRDGTALAEPLVIERAQIAIPDADGRLLPGDIGYLALHAYGERAADDLSTLMRSLSTGGARAWVLDLRDNGGGYRNVAIAVTSKFVATGPIVTVQDRRGRRTTLVADRSATLPLRPLVVLVNGNTASAAEITASAVADDGTGTLVGRRTFGKGLVQQIFPLPDGAAMKITTERYVTANGRDIDRKGIEPDVAIDQPDGSQSGVPGHDPQLDRALEILTQRLGAPSPSPAAR